MKKIMTFLLILTLCTFIGCDSERTSNDSSLDISQEEVSSNEISSEPASNIKDISDKVESKLFSSKESSEELTTQPPQEPTVSLPTKTSSDETYPVSNVKDEIEPFSTNIRIADKDNNSVKTQKLL